MTHSLQNHVNCKYKLILHFMKFAVIELINSKTLIKYTLYYLFIYLC